MSNSKQRGKFTGRKHSRQLTVKLMTAEEELIHWKERAELAEQTLDDVLHGVADTNVSVKGICILVGVMIGIVAG